MATMYMT